MHKKVKFKGPSGLSAFLFFNSHNFDNHYSNEKNKISKSKLGCCLFKTKSISEIEQKAFFLLLIKRRTFVLGHPVVNINFANDSSHLGTWLGGPLIVIACIHAQLFRDRS